MMALLLETKTVAIWVLGRVRSQTKNSCKATDTPQEPSLMCDLQRPLDAMQQLNRVARLKLGDRTLGP